jgi:hypothetical protein
MNISENFFMSHDDVIPSFADLARVDFGTACALERKPRQSPSKEKTFRETSTKIQQSKNKSESFYPPGDERAPVAGVHRVPPPAPPVEARARQVGRRPRQPGGPA